MLEINLLSLMAGFGVGGIVGEILIFAFMLKNAYHNDPWFILPVALLVSFLILYLIVVDWHSIALTFLGAALYHFAAFAKRKCLASKATA